MKWNVVQQKFYHVWEVLRCQERPVIRIYAHSRVPNKRGVATDEKNGGLKNNQINWIVGTMKGINEAQRYSDLIRCSRDVYVTENLYQCIQTLVLQSNKCSKGLSRVKCILKIESPVGFPKASSMLINPCKLHSHIYYLHFGNKEMEIQCKIINPRLLGEFWGRI